MNLKNLKYTLRNSFIFLFSVFGVAFLYRKYIQRKSPLVRIVVFHDVPDSEWFEAMIATLKNLYNVITPEEFYTSILNAEKINVLVTFDDGYQSWVDVALPVLQKYGVQGIFFINSGLIDVAEDESAVEAFMKENLCITPKQALAWGGVRRLLHAQQTIGGHARTHARLSTLTDSELEREISDDKRVLEGQLSQAVIHFAYPFGTTHDVNTEVVLRVQGAGYRRAYTATSAFVTNSETFLTPRMCIETGLSPRNLRRWVEGGYDLFNMCKTSLK